LNAFSVPQAIHDLLSVIHTAKKSGENSDFGRRLINLEVEDKVLVGNGSNARSNFRLSGAAVGGAGIAHSRLIN